MIPGSYTKDKMSIRTSKRRRLKPGSGIAGYAGSSIYLQWLSRALLFALVVCFVYAGREIMLSPNYFPLTKIKINGEFQHIQPATIQRLVTPSLQRGFWGVNTSSLQEEIQQMPWVDKVSVSRSWPQALTISLKEQQPVAHWNGDGLVSQKGQVFTPPAANKQSGLPFLTGPLGRQLLMLSTYHDLAQLLRPLGLKVHQLYLTDRNAWQIQLSNGIIVNAGNKDVVLKMKKFATVYEQLFAARADNIAYVDVRYNNGIAVKWKA